MSTSEVSIDPRKADAAYKSFPDLIAWAKCRVDAERWAESTSSLGQLENTSPTTLTRAHEIIKLATAIDTGAIEGLYEVDRGFTFSVAVQTALWQAAVEKEKGSKVRALIESQLNAYDFVLDFATRKAPIAEAWIRQLHAEMTKSQETYSAHTEIGVQELQLNYGEYKHLPNHVMRSDGTIHSHAPVDLTPIEMHRLCEELRSEAFSSAHPILQASYAHYALAVIHPFADGNGRVARALASVYTYRSNSIPLLVLAENRREYLATLEAADLGDFQTFVDFVLERAIDTISLTVQSLRAAALPQVDESLAEMRRIYTTKSGYTHGEVDAAGLKLFDLFKNELEKQIREVDTSLLYYSRVQAGSYVPAKSTNRLPIVHGPQSFVFRFTAKEPGRASVSAKISLEVPINAGPDDTLELCWRQNKEFFDAKLREILPNPTAAVQMRISIWVRRIIAKMLEDLTNLASEELKKLGLLR